MIASSGSPPSRGILPYTREVKRTRLRLAGTSDRAVLKREIQSLLRYCVIARDGGCVLKGHGTCTEILQAEHLITRGNSATFADLRNIVCLCTYHHLFFKKQHGMEYWQLVEQKIGPVRWKWLQLALADRSPHKVDLQLEKIALQHELEKLRGFHEKTQAFAY